MRALDCLRVVHEVRRRREEAAERALVTICKEILLAKSNFEQLRVRLAEITEARVREIERVATAAHYQANDAWHRRLLQQCAEAEKTMQRLEALRAEQMRAYLDARCARETVGELQKRSRAVREAEINMREQKWNEDVFLARKVSNSNMIMHSEQLADSKELA